MRSGDDEWVLLDQQEATDVSSAHFFHVLDRDPSLIDILSLAPGHVAHRASVGDTWSTRPIS